jgi:hypothetical protein
MPPGERARGAVCAAPASARGDRARAPTASHAQLLQVTVEATRAKHRPFYRVFLLTVVVFKIITALIVLIN